MDQRHQEEISKLWRKIEIMDDNIIEMRTPISKLRVTRGTVTVENIYLVD
jgi:2-methylcitrate dehydratase PrpD